MGSLEVIDEAECGMMDVDRIQTCQTVEAFGIVRTDVVAKEREVRIDPV